MRIAFVGSADSVLKIFPELIEAIAKEIPSLEPETFFAATALDIPAKLKEIEDFDFVLVFYAFKRNEFKAKVLAEKLIDLELKGGMKIIKGIEKVEGEPESAKEELVKKYAKIAVSSALNPEAFSGMEFAEQEEETGFFDFLK